MDYKQKLPPEFYEDYIDRNIELYRSKEHGVFLNEDGLFIEHVWKAFEMIHYHFIRVYTYNDLIAILNKINLFIHYVNNATPFILEDLFGNPPIDIHAQQYCREYNKRTVLPSPPTYEDDEEQPTDEYVLDMIHYLTGETKPECDEDDEEQPTVEYVLDMIHYLTGGTKPECDEDVLIRLACFDALVKNYDAFFDTYQKSGEFLTLFDKLYPIRPLAYCNHANHDPNYIQYRSTPYQDKKINAKLSLEIQPNYFELIRNEKEKARAFSRDQMRRTCNLVPAEAYQWKADAVDMEF